MIVLEVLIEHGELWFSRLTEFVTGISQKMLTKTLRQVERDRLLIRTVHPVIPPHVEYRLTELGESLAEAFCGVWAAQHHAEVARARRRFDARGGHAPADS
ncbi:helix-turn-helix transcriptional regulator [Chloroflexia bacterium SDU3-3]|nr:helix-turn-helix transcriptional regulator [Chloroflexia bacterium SDU3-3]